jgi:DNA-binding LacI/PurR family transcriptional regulator
MAEAEVKQAPRAPKTAGTAHPATAADVAEEVGMSVAAVSLVINGKATGRVSEAKRALVWEAVERLGYAVHPGARSLATGLSSQVALVVPDFLNPSYSGVAMGVAAALGAEYQIFFVVTEIGYTPGSATLAQATALRPGGLIVTAPNEALLRSFKPTCPLVLADATGLRSSLPTVNMDVVGGAKKLADHLLALGHSRIAYLDGSTRTATFAARRSALRRRLVSRGAALVGQARSHVAPDEAAETFRQIWPEWQKNCVSAVVCATDLQAYGVMRVAAEIGLRIPDDMALAGFDNLPFSAIVSPALTTVELPAFVLGKAAGQLLRDTLLGEESDAPLLCGGELKIRASTAGREPRRNRQ